MAQTGERREDPLLDPAAVRRIRAVILRGRVYERAGLDELLDGVEAYSHPPHLDLPLPPGAEGLCVGSWRDEQGSRAEVMVREEHLEVSFDGGPFYLLLHQGEHRYRLEADPRVEVGFALRDGRPVELWTRSEEEAGRYRRPEAR